MVPSYAPSSSLPHARTHKQVKTVSVLDIVEPVGERQQKGSEYGLNYLIYKSQMYDDGLTAEVQKMRKKVAIQIKDRAFKGKTFILLINVPPSLSDPFLHHEFKKVSLPAFSRIYEPSHA